MGVYVGELDDLRRYVGRVFGREEAFDRHFFDDKYQREDPFRYENSAYDELKRELVRFLLRGRRFRNLLDVGSGEGYLARHIRDNADTISLLDCSNAAVERARARVDIAGENLVGDACEMLARLPDGFCDAIVVSEMLYYVAPLPFNRYGRTLRREIVRVLEPGGRLVLVHPLGWWLHAAYRWDRRLAIVRRVTLKTYRSVEALALERRV